MRTLAAVALGLALVAGCDDSSGPGGGVVGTYQLQSVNGDPVPSTLEQGTAYLLEVTGGNLTVRSNGTYTATFAFRENDNGTITTVNQTENGTWEGDASELVLTDDSDGEIVVATVSGSTLTVDDGIDVWVFRR